MVEVQVEKRLVHIHLVPIKKRCKGSNYFPPNAVSQETLANDELHSKNDFIIEIIYRKILWYMLKQNQILY